MVLHRDVESTEVGPPKPLPFYKALLSNISDGQAHDIKQFLSRPVAVSEGSWTVSNGSTVVLDSIALPGRLITEFPMFSQKITGFLGFRAKVVLRLQVNCNRFMQGRLVMSFFPQAADFVSKFAYYNSSLVQITQLPRVDFDAASDTEVQLEIPYVSPYLAYNTTNNTGQMGNASLHVYSPLVTTGSESSAEFVIWGHFEDVELMYPTISNATYVP